MLRHKHISILIEIFDQVYGVGMGSPARPALVNLFMGSNEQKWLKSDRDRLVKFYHRDVNDVFYLFENEHETLTLLDFLNKTRI